VIRPRGLSYDSIVVENSRFNSAVQILEDLALAEHEEGARWRVKLTAEGKRFLRAELAGMERT
jgi:predicted transcriptional regulator